MSIRVELPDLPKEIVARGAAAFLLSSIMDSRPHAAHLTFDVATADGQVQLRASAGRTARGNIGNRPAVTVLWPADQSNEHSLIVDGEGRLDGDDHVIITATSAILHRPAPSAASS
ncbi:MAG: hypothetical protein AAF531_21935 [Actinomycetota bacterium]